MTATPFNTGWSYRQPLSPFAAAQGAEATPSPVRRTRRLAGICSASPKTAERFDADTWTTFDGRALAVVRPTGSGPVTVTVTAPDPDPVALILAIEP